MANCISYEEPGGYLQWGEYDLESRLMDHLLPNEADGVLEAAKQLYSGICRAVGGEDSPWTAKLQEVFAKIGLQEIEVDDRPFEPIWSKFWHEQEMSFCAQVIGVLATKKKEMADKFHELQQIVQTAKHEGKGYVNDVRPVVAVGRKPVQ